MRIRQLLRCTAWLARPALTGPLSGNWGREWGTPVDRLYIEQFLEENSSDIRGDVLEVMDDHYTRRFGSDISSTTILDLDPGNAQADLVADLQEPGSFPENVFDCAVVTQTLQFVYDLHAAAQALHGALRPGGVCLATVPTISKRHRGSALSCDYWRLTPDALGRVFEDEFGAGSVSVASFGSARTAVGFLLGLAAEDFSPPELQAVDTQFPLLAAVRAVKQRLP